MTAATQKSNGKTEDNIEHSYARAHRILKGIWTDHVAFNATVYPVWIESSDCFWYQRTTKSGEGDSAVFGKQYRLVEAKTAINKLAFDHGTFASSLSEAAAQKVDPENLPIDNVDISLCPSTVTFTAFDKRWKYDCQQKKCLEIQLLQDNWLQSPDKAKVVFTRDDNLWVRNLKTGNEHALTHDGHKEYSYGAMSTAWGTVFDSSVLPQVKWSPDSKMLFAIQRDTRKVKKLPVVHHVPKDGSLRPQLEQVSLAFPGDEHVETYRLVAINIETGRLQAADYSHIHVSSPGHGFFTEGKGWWSQDSRHIYFIDLERGYKRVSVVVFDACTGVTRVLFSDTEKTQINLNLHYDDRPTFMPLPDSDEIIWFSERSGWAHLYLYDLKTGALKNKITHGAWLVRGILSFDISRREAFIQTAGRCVNSNGDARNSDRDPYYCDLARVNIDTGDIFTIVASDHDYFAVSKKNFNTYVAIDMGRDARLSNSVSPTGNFALVTRSRADEIPVSTVYDREGSEVLLLETADISALPDGWHWPEPVKLLAADGETDIYGLIFRPSDFSPENSYPIVSHIMNVPESPWVSKGSFSNGETLDWSYLDAAALAELGFIVVQIDGRGAPLRNKAFQDETYGDYCSSSKLQDHVAGIKQLAKRYPYMDINRVGITTHLAGGSGGVLGLLQHSEFYKVGINGCLHDSRLCSASMLGEKYEGMSVPIMEPLETKVENLKGKLLLCHGLLDQCVPPASSLRVVEALQKANKDFEMIVLPNMGHASCPDYLTRRTWDFLVRHLLEIEPPKEYRLMTFAGGYEVAKCAQ